MFGGMIATPPASRTASLGLWWCLWWHARCLVSVGLVHAAWTTGGNKSAVHHYGRAFGRENSYLASLYSSSKDHDVLPEFAEPVPNVTAIVGRSVKLPCVVNNLGHYRVAWLRVESKTILTIHKSVITQNYRVHLSPSDRTWLLVIDSVQESDRGGYMCQVNTVPMHSQVGYLDVLVPPDIVGSESSSDVLVREGSNVTLSCRAKGYPAPRITWRREDGTPIAVGNWQEQLGSTATDNVSYEGEELSITKVSRLHMGPYLCIASNGVPSPVSRRILLQVHFPPMIWIPNQLIGAPLGGEVVMDCNTEAFPMSINYWTLESGDLIAESAKYSLNRTENVYKVHMRLRIRRIVPEDFGAYRCFAKNSLGSTEGSIRLYEIHIPPPPKVKEPSTARIQSIEESKMEVPRDSITKQRSYPARPPLTGSPAKAQGKCFNSGLYYHD
ncbi:lachesin [Rhipicephalus sanguineus]|uniref:lachesin n=1 Tax=Rhipicephalus sanguineus TaxID=34632 RepID=UPI0020C285D7|nr:lachesin [Rhipicephalus sanguineus]